MRIYHYPPRDRRFRLAASPARPDHAAAGKSLLDRHAGTFNGLVRDYKLSLQFGKFAGGTQKGYRRMLTSAGESFTGHFLKQVNSIHEKYLPERASRRRNRPLCERKVHKFCKPNANRP